MSINFNSLLFVCLFGVTGFLMDSYYTLKYGGKEKKNHKESAKHQQFNNVYLQQGANGRIAS